MPFAIAPLMSSFSKKIEIVLPLNRSKVLSDPPPPPFGFSVTTGYPFFFQKSSDPPPLNPPPPLRPLGLPQTTNHYRTEDTIVLKYN